MPTGNKFDPEFTARLRQARDLLNEAIEMSDGGAPKAPRIAANTAKKIPVVVALDFSMPMRPFIKAHSAGMSGAQKFALLIARLTKGDEKNTVSLADIEKEWNRMTNLLGGKFNGAHSGRARDSDLVATEKMGFYRLRPNWKSIFK